MDIEVIFVLQVVGSEFAEAVVQSLLERKRRKRYSSEEHILSFIPCHNVGEADLVETGKEGEGSKDEGRNNPFPLVESFEERWLLVSLVSVQCLPLHQLSRNNLRTCLATFFFSSASG